MNSIIVEPDTVAPKGHHLHQCPNCSTVWMHSDENAGNDWEHTCVVCGAEQWDRFYPEQLLTAHELADVMVIMTNYVPRPETLRLQRENAYRSYEWDA